MNPIGPIIRASLTLTAFLSLGTVSAQTVQVSAIKGGDGCPELRVLNNGRKTVDVSVEFTIQQRSSEGKMRGGTKTDVLDNAAPGSRIYPTYVFTVNCDRPYEFQHRVTKIQER